MSQPPWNHDAPVDSDLADGPGPARDDTAMAQRFTLDPFIVLQAAPTASGHDLDGVAMRLLEALAAGLPGADRYPTPLGPRRRDPETVTAAALELRERERRIVHEVWARMPVREQPVESAASAPAWAGGERALGWRPR